MLTRFFDRVVQRYLPDAFLFAVILSLLVYALGIVFTESGPIEMIAYWGDGFWDLLAFGMQMTLVVVTGYILASTPVVKNTLSNLSKLAKTPAQAVMLVTFVANFACLINYGFGLVVGALFSIHVARQVPAVDFRILVASAYSGMIIWHGGLSASIPLTIATPGHFLEDTIGRITVIETLFSPLNIFIVIVLLITLPIFNRWLLKGAPEAEQIDRTDWELPADDAAPADSEPQTPAEKLENSQIISLLIGILGLVYVFYHFAVNGFDLNINIVNFSFLFLGILLHRTPKRFLDTVSNGVKNAGGIIIQFPFYAGIMGMMSLSGLSDQISLWFVSFATDYTLPMITFISAAIVNIFVPSGGGQWAVQGPIMMQAAIDLGANIPKTAMAVAWGEAWTNMLQPFWALPLLAIAGLKIRDIMGFCIMILIFSFFPIAIGLLLF